MFFHGSKLNKYSCLKVYKKRQTHYFVSAFATNCPIPYKSNLIPCASGRSVPKLMVLVCLRIYTFHASEPDSRPPPVSFSPPKAPPISAPEVPILTLAIPQSETERNNSASR